MEYAFFREFRIKNLIAIGWLSFEYQCHSVEVSSYLYYSDFTLNQFFDIFEVLKIEIFAILVALHFADSVNFNFQKMQKHIKIKLQRL